MCLIIPPNERWTAKPDLHFAKQTYTCEGPQTFIHSHQAPATPHASPQIYIYTPRRDPKHYAWTIPPAIPPVFLPPVPQSSAFLREAARAMHLWSKYWKLIFECDFWVNTK